MTSSTSPLRPAGACFAAPSAPPSRAPCPSSPSAGHRRRAATRLHRPRQEAGCRHRLGIAPGPVAARARLARHPGDLDAQHPQWPRPQRSLRGRRPRRGHLRRHTRHRRALARTRESADRLRCGRHECVAAEPARRRAQRQGARGPVDRRGTRLLHAPLCARAAQGARPAEIGQGDSHVPARWRGRARPRLDRRVRRADRCRTAAGLARLSGHRPGRPASLAARDVGHRRFGQGIAGQARTGRGVDARAAFGARGHPTRQGHLLRLPRRGQRLPARRGQGLAPALAVPRGRVSGRGLALLAEVKNFLLAEKLIDRDFSLDSWRANEA